MTNSNTSENTIQSKNDSTISPSKPKILILADTPNWAYHNIQKFIVAQLSDRFDFYTDFICFQQPPSAPTLRKRVSRFVFQLRNKHFRRVLKSTETYDVVVQLGFYFTRWGKLPFRSNNLVKGIYTDGFPPQMVDEADSEINIEQFVEKYLGDATAVVCGSKTIEDRFKDKHPWVTYANGPLCKRNFQRIKPKILNKSSRFVVGWTGTPNRPFKGFHDYIVPAVERAAQMRPGLELKTRFSGPLETLPRFYDDVDVILIASSADAGPSLFAEGGLCEVPSISTRIGFPSEVIEHGLNGLFVKRNVEEMAMALVRLYDDRELLLSMSRRIRLDIDQSLGEEINRKRWLELFSRLTAN